MVLFLAQNPKNREQWAEPLKGTAAGRRLALWLRLMGDPEHVLLHASQKPGPVTWKDYDAVTVAETAAQCQQHVALGAYASGLLERLGIKHFTLPHPSDLKGTDSEQLARQLDLCRVYVARSRRGSP